MFLRSLFIVVDKHCRRNGYYHHIAHNAQDVGYLTEKEEPSIAEKIICE